jgi:nucleoid DNA-binding protein
LFCGGASVIMFKRHPRVNGALVKMVESLQLFYDVVLNGLGQLDVVSRKNQLHGRKMQSEGKKIQLFLEICAHSESRATF